MIRKEYCFEIKENVSDSQLMQTIQDIQKKAQQEIQQGMRCALCIYRHQKMIFIYEELVETACHETIQSTVSDVLLPFVVLAKTLPSTDDPIALMEPIYWHCVPTDPASWLKDRHDGKTRIGRIARLLPGKKDSYVYWHKRIVQEGLLKGDKYQFISLYGDILFSYFEEPRLNVNLAKSNEESSVIKGWMAVDPESHFDRVFAKGSNFLVIEPLLLL